MQTYIVFLKGINVGGHKKIPMSALRTILESVDFNKVRTYIQSGNVILTSDLHDRYAIEKKVKHAIETQFGYEVSVLAMTRPELQSIFDRCPFSDEERKKTYFMLLHETPSQNMINSASEKVYEGETYLIIQNCIYYYSEKGFGKSKFNTNLFERRLNTFATARNYNTILKLLSLSAE